MSTRQQRRAAERAQGREARPLPPALQRLDEDGRDHVVAPLRNELIAIVRRNLRSRHPKLEFTDIGFWVDVVSEAVNERMEQHAPGISARSATPMGESA